MALNPLLPVIVDTATSLANTGLGFYSTEKTNRTNMQLARYAYSKDLEMWNRQNQYNSPEAQMARLKKAGLNPNLVYGHGAVGNTASNLPKYNAPTVNYDYRIPLSGMDKLAMYQDFQVKKAQTDNLQAQRRNIEAQTAINVAKASTEYSLRNQTIENLRQRSATEFEKSIRENRYNRILRETMNDRIKQIGINLVKTQADIEAVNANRRLKEIETDWYGPSKVIGLAKGLFPRMSNITNIIQKKK